MRSSIIALLALGLAGPSRAQTQLPPQLSEYVVLALDDATIRRETRVLSGAVGAVGGSVHVGRAARTNLVAAPTVQLAAASRIGNVFCHLVSGPPTLPSCRAFTDPIVDPALLLPVSVVPGADDIRLPRHTGTAPVPAASFRDVRIGAGSVLQLSGGTYAMRSLRIGRNARLECVSDCRIGIVGPVRLRSGARLGAAAPSRANTVRIDIDPTAPAPAFIARARAIVSATIFAPAGDVILGALGTHRGAFIGRTVVVGHNATLRADSALGKRAHQHDPLATDEQTLSVWRHRYRLSPSCRGSRARRVTRHRVASRVSGKPRWRAVGLRFRLPLGSTCDSASLALARP